MSTESLIRKDDEYTRESLTPHLHARSQYLTYLTKVKHLPLHTAEKVIDNLIAEQRIPKVVRYTRKDLLDKHLERVPLTTYLQNVSDEGGIMVPTLTTYVPKTRKLSFHSELITHRLAWRNTTKQEMFDAYTMGQSDVATYKGLLQVAIKTGNNSITGIYGINGNPITNKSAHSTLTSSTRASTNTVNVALERLFSGTVQFRHQDSPRNYMLTMLNEYMYNKPVIDQAINDYQLHLVTADELYQWLRTQSEHYWINSVGLSACQSMCQELDGYARSFILYGGNLWGLAQYNDILVRRMIDDLIKPGKLLDIPIQEAQTIVKHAHDAILNCAHHINHQQLRGGGNNYHKMDPILVIRLASTCIYIESVLSNYSAFLTPFMTLRCPPPDMAYTKSMIRYSIAGSDTDSNLITVENWAEWYTGSRYPNDRAIQMIGVMSIFAGTMTDDVLRQLSINMGISREDMNGISMKSEYTPLVLVMVTLTKTYFQAIYSQEKNILPKPKMIIKGVHLKSSNAPPDLRKRALEFMESITSTVIKGEKLSLTDTLNMIMGIEREVITSVIHGNSEYLRTIRLNPTDSYKDKSPLKNNSGWAHFWEGYIQCELPTRFAKVPTTLVNRTVLMEWVLTLPPTIQPTIKTWLSARGKKDLPTIYIPLEYVVGHGIPAFVRTVIDIESILSDVCNVFYIVLMGLGYYKHKALTVLESEGYDIKQIILDTP